MTTPDVLGARYELNETLGTGGMATVYRGTDRVLHRTVAVKVLADPYASDESFVERFRHEAQAAASLSHPGIVSVFDTGSDDGSHYIVMEHVDGRTVAEELAAEGPLPPDRAALIAEQAAAALAFAHEHGIVHRDVKPANIMLGPNGDVKVMDFGIARAAKVEAITHTAPVLGTAKYISPEQAEGKRVDARTDVYALGVTLFEMLTGREPFTGDSPVAIAYKHVSEEPAPPSELNPAIPAALDTIVLRAMQKDRADRYQSAEDMRLDLARFRGGEELAGAPTLGAIGRGTVAMGAVDTGELEPVEAAGGGEHRRGRRAWMYVVGLVAILGMIAVAAVTAGGGRSPLPARHDAKHPRHRVTATPVRPTPSVREAPTTPTASTTPSAHPSPSPTPSPSPSLKPSPKPSPKPTSSPSPQVSPTPSPSPS